MFAIGDTVGIYRNDDVDTVPIGQGVLTKMTPHYVVENLRWRFEGSGRTRLQFNVATRLELYEGHVMLRPERHQFDGNLLAKWFPPGPGST